MYVVVTVVLVSNEYYLLVARVRLTLDGCHCGGSITVSLATAFNILPRFHSVKKVMTFASEKLRSIICP